MRALVLNCSLKPGGESSNTQLLADVVVEALRARDVICSTVRLADLDVHAGVVTDSGNGDEWPRVHEQVVKADILVVATPTWVGHPSSIAQRVLERLDAMISETDANGRPLAYGKVAGVVVTGNEDGAHHVISEVAGGLGDIGFTVPAQAWTYWNRGPGPGPSYSETVEGHDWAASTGRTMAQNLVSCAEALAAHPYDPPPA